MWISACIVAFYFNAHAGSWSNEIHETGVNPTLIRMITTYTPQYLARSGRNGYVEHSILANLRAMYKVKRLLHLMAFKNVLSSDAKWEKMNIENADGVRKLRLSVTSIKVRDDLIRPCSNTNESFNLDAFVDVSI